MSIRIITDSGCDISQKEAKEKGIVVLPLTTIINQKEYRDGIDIQADEFYEQLISTDIMPTTSQVTIGAFLDAFEQYKDDEILCMTISSQLSGCFQSANVAAQDYEKVRIVDTMNVSLGSRNLIELALSYIEKGMDIDSIVEQLEMDKTKCKVYAYFDTLEFLKRGGRISSAVAAAGSILNIKPVLTLKEGIIEMSGKARGLKKAGSCMAKCVLEDGMDFSKPYHLAYSGCSKEGVLSFLDNNKELNLDSGKIVQIGPTIGTHAGPGAVAISYFVK